MKSSKDLVVPIGFLATAVTAGLWIGALNAFTKTNSEDITQIKKDEKTWQQTVINIDTRLSRIEGALNIQVEEEGNEHAGIRRPVK